MPKNESTLGGTSGSNDLRPADALLEVLRNWMDCLSLERDPSQNNPLINTGWNKISVTVKIIIFKVEKKLLGNTIKKG